MQTLAEYLEPIRVARQNDADRARCAQLIAQCEASLCPQGMLEVAVAASIFRALWRLERGPAASEVDRTRIENGMRRNTAELRRLQTDRYLKAELNLDLPGLVSAKDALKFLKHLAKSEKLQNEPNPPDAKALEASLHAQIEEEEQRQLAEYYRRKKQSAASSPQDLPAFQSLGRGTQKTGGVAPRNAPCPCGSGHKHKRCCGSGTPLQYRPSPQAGRAA